MQYVVLAASASGDGAALARRGDPVRPYNRRPELPHSGIMNPRLAGFLSCATVVLAAAAAWWLWRPAPPAAAPAMPADATALPAAGRIERAAQAVAAQAGAPAYAGIAESLPRPRQGFLVTFQAAGVTAGPADPAAARQAWRARFCTEALLAALRDERVQVVTGRVIDGNGRTLYAADCLPQPAVPAGAGQPGAGSAAPAPPAAGPAGPYL
jgi:hypothetical protein